MSEMRSGAVAMDEHPGGCPVCGSDELQLDGVEVGPTVWMRLAECGRCEHRWTALLPEPAEIMRGPLWVGPEAAHEGNARAA